MTSSWERPGAGICLREEPAKLREDQVTQWRGGQCSQRQDGRGEAQAVLHVHAPVCACVCTVCGCVHVCVPALWVCVCVCMHSLPKPVSITLRAPDMGWGGASVTWWPHLGQVPARPLALCRPPPRPTVHTEQFAGRWLRAELLSCLPLFLPLTGTAPCPAPTRPAVPSLPASAGKSWGSSQALGPPQACPQRHPQQLHLLKPRKGPPHLLGRSLCLQLPVSPTPHTRQAEGGWGRGCRLSAP